MFTGFAVDYMTLFGVWTAICAYSTINTLERSPNGMCSNFTKSWSWTTNKELNAKHFVSKSWYIMFKECLS